MQIVVEEDRCEGHGMCELKAPEVLHLDLESDGAVSNLYAGRDLPAQLQEDAIAAAGVCPVAALRILG